MRRIVTEGLYRRQGAGKHACFEPTPKGLAVLAKWASRTRWAWGLDTAEHTWDGQWRLVGFGVPERERSRRDSFRAALVRLGGAAVHGGLYVSPHPWLDQVGLRAGRLEISEQVTMVTASELTVGTVSDPREVAATLWPVCDLAKRYGSLIESCTPVVDRLVDAQRRGRRISDGEAIAGAMALAVAFTEVFADDPLLPRELLPQPWPGQQARSLVTEGLRLARDQRGDRSGPTVFRFYDAAMASTTS